jgi:hypothetical protein
MVIVFELKNSIFVQSNLDIMDLDLVRKFFGPFNKETFKIDLDIMRTTILCEFFFGPFNRIISRFDYILQKMATQDAENSFVPFL